MDTPLWMVPEAERQSELPLDVQSRGRPLTEAEMKFADSLETVFADGCHDFAQVANRLTEMNVIAPVSGSSSWSVSSLLEELQQINSQLDKAFEESGYGA
ncbi:MAG: hypothetical protein KTR35_24510 [Gammaproteobacteria bacterium]|nr:hypothetical protein [Gammaproteobacteria bacterium]